MLGVRLDDDMEQRLTAVARGQGRSKSDVARDAVRRYLDQHDDALHAEARRQSLVAAAADDASDWAFAEAVEAEDAGWR